MRFCNLPSLLFPIRRSVSSSLVTSTLRPELQSALLLRIQGTTLRVPQLGYGDAPPAIADPTVKKYGNRFVITGYGWNRVDQHNPFEIDVTCP
jgi:hypothetical protein